MMILLEEVGPLLSICLDSELDGIRETRTPMVEYLIEMTEIPSNIFRQHSKDFRDILKLNALKLQDLWGRYR